VHVRIVTYNVHKCIGVDGRYDPERVVEVLRHHRPDVVLLQEVDDDAPRSRRHRQADLLADRLCLRERAWAGTVAVRGGGHYGNAILSRFPIVDFQKIDLSIPIKKARAALHARLRIGTRKRRTVHVYNLHLGLAHFERRIQLRRFFDTHPLRGLHRRAPVIVGGDFNDLWGTLGESMLAPVGFRGGPAVRTFPSYAPLRPLDSVYVRGDAHIAHVDRSRLPLARRASDHLPLVCDINLG
jgi:endonuclease/exonuclease/phosphatase family metal-dependent hydrolase